jgi:hypothetical protein
VLQIYLVFLGIQVCSKLLKASKELKKVTDFQGYGKVHASSFCELLNLYRFVYSQTCSRRFWNFKPFLEDLR